MVKTSPTRLTLLAMASAFLVLGACNNSSKGKEEKKDTPVMEKIDTPATRIEKSGSDTTAAEDTGSKGEQTPPPR